MHNMFNFQQIIPSGVPITEAMWKDPGVILPFGTIPSSGVFTRQIFPLRGAQRISIMVAETGPDTAFPLR